ncbi:MAG: phospholipid carrier-dependent glycosyltransferase [Euryarchaeota archaeon]|nr:phospholipid carrier-dependent glycosyltransferase [Euryarchaeota archaeon]
MPEPEPAPVAPPPAAEPTPPAPPPPSSPWRPPPRPIERTMPRWIRAGVPVLIFVAAFGFYQFQVDQPPIIVFDEAHYVKVARNYTRGVLVDPAWGDPRPQNFEHPPLAKYLIAAGIYVNGKPHDDWENQQYITKLCGHDNEECRPDAWGWRLASTVVGASGIAAAYLLGLRLFNRVSAGLFVAGLLALDGLYYMHSRLAMLDIFPTAFTIWGFALTLAPWRRGPWLGGILYGFALASKGYALFMLPAFVLVQFIRAGAPRWREPPATAPAADPVTGQATNRLDLYETLAAAWRPFRPWVVRFGKTILLSMVIPFVALLATYAPYLVLWTQMKGPGYAVEEWIFVQLAAFRWDFAGKATHPFSSGPATWIPMIRPVFYYTFDYPSGLVGKMYSLGNPFLWWTAVLGAIAVPVLIAVRFFRTGRHFLRLHFFDHFVWYPFALRRDLHMFVAALFVFSAYVPWFLIQRITFIFYMTPVTPTFAILAGGLLGEQWDRGSFPRVLTILYGAVALATFGIFFPIYSGTPIPREHFDWIMSLIPWMAWR